MRFVRVLAVGLLAPALAQAQRNIAWNFFLGTTNGALQQSARETVKGHTAGVTWALPITQGAALEMAGAFVQRGGQFQGTDVLLDYIEAPLSLRISDGSAGDGLRTFVRIGVAMSMKRKCEVLQNDVIMVAEFREFATSVVPAPGDACSRFRNQGYDVGPLAGVGFVWRDGTSRLTVELRRTDGRSRIPFGSTERVQPSTISILAGVGWAR